MPPRRARPVEVAETDRLEGFAHPRETQNLLGQEAALSVAARAIRSGRPPQAWLIVGPPGIGKATFAYRVARYLLAYGATDKGPADLGVPAKDPVTLQLAAGAHPGLLLIKRGINPDTGKLMTIVSVNEIRRLQNFFGMTSGAGGWRVAIVDTADDMNENAANALLKMLEEPPSRAMLLLLSNTPGRLLPTIRSRCQRLALKPLDDDVLESALAKLAPDLSPKARKSVVRLAGGSLGLALSLSGGDGIALASEADKLIDNAASADIPELISLAERLGRMTDGVDGFGEFLAQALSDRIRARAHQGAPKLDRWTDCLAALNESFERTAGLHLEPKQTVLSAARTIAATTKQAGKV